MSFDSLVQRFLLHQKYLAIDLLGRKVCISSTLFNVPTVFKGVAMYTVTSSVESSYCSMLLKIKDYRLSGYSPSHPSPHLSRKLNPVENSMGKIPQILIQLQSCASINTIDFKTFYYPQKKTRTLQQSPPDSLILGNH